MKGFYQKKEKNISQYIPEVYYTNNITKQQRNPKESNYYKSSHVKNFYESLCLEKQKIRFF